MRFRCERDTLQEALATAQRAVASRSGANPVLFDVMVHATADGLEIVGSDLDITNRLTVPAEVLDAGGAVFPKVLGDLLRKLQPGAVEISVDDNEATIASGTFSTVLRLKAADDYPRITQSTGEGPKVNAQAFSAALRQVIKAASKDDMRPMLTGVLIAARPGGDGIRLVATDSYRLAMRELPGESTAILGDTQQVLVAAKGLAEVQRLAGGGDIEVLLNDRFAVFRTAAAEVSVRLIEAEFPKYEQLIPKSFANRLVVDKDALRAVVERVSVVGQSRDNANVRLEMSATNGLEVSMTLTDVGTAKDHLDAKYEGTDLTIAFNPAFLLEGIDACEGDEIALETQDNVHPAVLRSTDDYVYLLMPVRTP